MIVGVLAGALFSFWPSPVSAHHEQDKIRYFMNRCSQSQPLACLHRATLHRHVSYPTARFIAWRESRYDPYATNPSSGAAGLVQFLASTWAGSWNPYRVYSPYSAKWASLAYALAVSRGYSSWWACC